MSDGLQRRNICHGRTRNNTKNQSRKRERRFAKKKHLPRTNTEMKRSKEDAFATDEHGITRKLREAFSPRRRKGIQEI